MDAITMLEDDHQAVEKLFTRFEKAGDRAYKEKREIVDRIIEALSVHAAVEEQLFYPVTRETVPETDDVVLESIEEHHVVKWLLSELEAMDPHDERFDAKVTVLIENVRHHVEEEEQDYFPKVRQELGRNALSDLGDAMTEARKAAPTHPHPRSPQTPPANLVAGAADRIGDTVAGVAQGGIFAAQDLVALVLRRERPRRAPQGSTVSRTTARRVRGTVDGAADEVVAAIRQARDTGEDTVTAARSGAKGTATSARRGARRTATTAKRAATTTKKAAQT